MADGNGHSAAVGLPSAWPWLPIISRVRKSIWGGGPPADSTPSRNVSAPDATQHRRSGVAGFPAAAAHIH
eukprot:266569-Pyramimonas_sp.AAC.1